MGSDKRHVPSLQRRHLHAVLLPCCVALCDKQQRFGLMPPTVVLQWQKLQHGPRWHALSWR